MDEPVHELTRAIASGDTEAFAQFYEEWFDLMLAHAKRTTGRDEAFCLDVVQDAMLRVIGAMPVLDSRAQLAQWTRRVVRSCAFDRIRIDLRRALRERRHDPTSRNGRHSFDDDHVSWLRRQLDDLDDASVEMLLMRHRMGWTLARIGRALGLTAGAVDGRLNRITRALRARGSEEDHDD